MTDISTITLHNGDYGFPFLGFNYYDDYLLVVDFLKSKFNVTNIEYDIARLFDEFRGYFIHNNCKCKFDCYDMMGVIISISKNDSKYVFKEKYAFIKAFGMNAVNRKI